MSVEIENERRRMQLLAKSMEELRLFRNDAYERVKTTGKASLAIQFLLAGMNRNSQACDALVSILQQAFVEDGWILVRSMLEGVVNICYLQLADSTEADSYLFGTAAAVKHVADQFERLMGEPFFGLADEARKGNEEMIEEGNRRTGRIISHDNWSRLKLIQRVELLDAHLTLKLFRACYREIYANGNQFVHSNYFNMQAFHEELLGARVLNPTGRINEVNLVLSQACKVLLSLCIFLDQQFHLGKTKDLELIIDVLNESHALSSLPMGNFTL